jgi:hypothetical protein
MELHASVNEFFHEAVTSALKSKQVQAQDATEFYLVNLLVQYTSERVDEAPLAIKLAQANHALPEERARALREVGDTSLYMSGFFADALAGKMVAVDYYIAMGGAAYGQLAKNPAGLGAASGFFQNVYDELSGRFDTFVEVLGEIRAHTNIASSTNVLRLYEEWVRTGSDWVERRLRGTGLLPAEARPSAPGKLVS